MEVDVKKSHRPSPTALVTGASSGTGAAVAKLLAREGYRVALFARNASNLDQVKSSLAPGPHSGHLALTCDLVDFNQIRDAVATVSEELGALNLVVNAAGMQSREALEETGDAVLTAIVHTNLIGPAVVCRESLALLRETPHAVVVNIASVSGRRPVPGMAAYSASKAGVCALGDALRIEWAVHGISVCTLCPPGIGGPSGMSPDQVAAHVLALARKPRPELILGWRWRLRAVLNLIFPRWSDRLVQANLPGTMRGHEQR